MNVRVVCINRDSFDICREYNLWASKTKRIKNWNIGDVLVFRVNGNIAGYAKVTSEMFESDLAYWSDALYVYRFNLGDWNLLSENSWIEVNSEIKTLFMDSWGDHYGLKMINQVPLLEKQATILMDMLRTKLSV